MVLYDVSFQRDVLSNQELVDFFESRGCLCWGVNVNSEEGTRVLYTIQKPIYPFLTLVMLKGTQMTIIWRQEGEFPLPPSEEVTCVSYTLQESTYPFLALVMLKGTHHLETGR